MGASKKQGSASVQPVCSTPFYKPAQKDLFCTSFWKSKPSTASHAQVPPKNAHIQAWLLDRGEVNHVVAQRGLNLLKLVLRVPYILGIGRE